MVNQLSKFLIKTGSVLPIFLLLLASMRLSWALTQPFAVPTKTIHSANDINPPKDSGCSLQKKEEQMQGGHKNTKYPSHKESRANAVCLGVGPISAIK